MRGKDRHPHRYFGEAGITPAYAGKNFQVLLYLFIIWDHPRVCGEKYPPEVSIKGGVGITPAYAGKRGAFILSAVGKRDHPRVCGEKSLATAA